MHRLFFLLLLIGCQTAPISSQKTLRINNQGSIPSLHPHTGIDLHCRNVQKALFEGLTRLSVEGVPELAGAESVEISPSRLTYTFTLRPIVWDNGEPVLAKNYEYAWKRALSPTSNCLRPDLFYCIKNAAEAKRGEVSLDEVGIHTPEDHKLVVELNHPAPYLLDLLAGSLFSPLYDDSEAPTVFNGPFTLELIEPDSRILLRKSPSYWDAEHVQLDCVDISLISDPNTALLMYEKGEIDWVGHPFTMLSQDAIETLSGSQEFHSKPLAGVFWLCLNTESPPFTSPKVRQALSYAVDREMIAQHVVVGERPTKNLIPQSMGLPQSDQHEADEGIEIAQKLFKEGLEEIGLTPESCPPLRYSYSDIPGQKKIAETLQERWEQTFHVPVELQAYEWNVFFDSLGEKQVQIGGCIWFSLFNDPIYSLEFFKNKAHRYNASCWENGAYCLLLDQADREKDLEKRSELLGQAEAMILKEVPIIPLYIFHAKYLKSPRVHGLEVSELGDADLKWASIDEY